MAASGRPGIVGVTVLVGAVVAVGLVVALEVVGPDEVGEVVAVVPGGGGDSLVHPASAPLRARAAASPAAYGMNGVRAMA